MNQTKCRGFEASMIPSVLCLDTLSPLAWCRVSIQLSFNVGFSSVVDVGFFLFFFVLLGEGGRGRGRGGGNGKSWNIFLNFCANDV